MSINYSDFLPQRAFYLNKHLAPKTLERRSVHLHHDQWGSPYPARQNHVHQHRMANLHFSNAPEADPSHLMICEVDPCASLPIPLHSIFPLCILCIPSQSALTPRNPNSLLEAVACPARLSFPDVSGVSPLAWHPLASWISIVVRSDNPLTGTP